MDKFTSELSDYRTLLLLDKIQSKAEKILISIGLILVTLVLGISIILNSIFGISIYWATEFAQYATVWVIFIGASTLIRLSEHVNLDILIRVLSKKMELFLQVFIYIVATLFVFYLIYIGWVMTLEIFSKGQTGSNFKISMGWVYLSFPVGMTLMAINSIKILVLKIKEIKNLKGGKD